MPIRLNSPSLALLAAACLCSLCSQAFADPPHLPDYPGTKYDLTDATLWVPQASKPLRGIYVNGSLWSNYQQAAAAWGFAILATNDVLIGQIPSMSTADFQAVLDEAATKSGHPELKNASLISEGGSRTSGIPAQIAKLFPTRTIAIHSGQPGDALTTTPMDVPGLNDQCEASAPPYDSGIRNMVNIVQDAINQGHFVTFVPQWGWPHGSYSSGDFALMWFDHMIKLRLPADANPTNGPVPLKKLDMAQGWLGDEATMYGLDAKTYPYNQYPGDKKKASWLPDADIARVWCAMSSRHPTETQKDQGEGHVGGAASSYSESGQANLMIFSPSRPYNLDKLRGLEYPAVPVGTKILIKAGHFGVQHYNADSVIFYEGGRILGALPGSPYETYQLAATLNTPGVTAISAYVKLKDGSRVTTRPAFLFVQPTDIFKTPIDSTILALKPTPTIAAGTTAGTFKNPNLLPWTLGLETALWNWSKFPMSQGGYNPDGSYTFLGNGHGIYWCWDRAAIAFVADQVLNQGFTFTARIRDLPANGIGDGNGNDFGMVGIAVKGGLDARMPVLSLRWDYYWDKADSGRGLDWFDRWTPSASIGLHNAGEKGCGVAGVTGQGCLGRGYENRLTDYKSAKNLWMRVKREVTAEGGKYYLYVKADGAADWTPIPAITSTANPCGGTVSVASLPYFLVPEDNGGLVNVGLMASSGIYAAGTMAATFDSISIQTEGGTTRTLPPPRADQARRASLAPHGDGLQVTLPFACDGDPVLMRVFDPKGKTVAETRIDRLFGDQTLLPTRGLASGGNYVLSVAVKGKAVFNAPFSTPGPCSEGR